MPKLKIVENNVEIPESLARLLAASPDDFKNSDKYEETMEVARTLLRLLLSAK
jgi:hypothetical protein